MMRMYLQCSNALKGSFVIFMMFMSSCSSVPQYHSFVAENSDPAALELAFLRQLTLEQARRARLKVPSVVGLATGQEKPLSPEEFQEQLDQAGHDWFFGHGIGRALVNVGVVISFPPYLLYLLGDAGAQMLGYESISPIQALPEPAQNGMTVVYDGVTMVPGYVNSLVFEEKFVVKKDSL